MHYIYRSFVFGTIALLSSGCSWSSWINLKTVQSSSGVLGSFDQTVFYKGNSNPNSVDLSGVCNGPQRLKFKIANLTIAEIDCVYQSGQVNGLWTTTLDISSYSEGSITIQMLDGKDDLVLATLTGYKDLSVQTPAFVSFVAPSSSFSANPTVTARISNLESGATINFYHDFTCTNLHTTKIANSSTQDFVLSFSVYGSYGFYIRQIDLAGNSSSCSQNLEQYTYAKEFNITSTTTLTNVDVGIDGICLDSNSKCSFRAAIDEANADAQTPYVFNFEAGTYTYANCTGLVATNHALKFVGTGPTSTIFEGTGVDYALCGAAALAKLHLKDILFQNFNGGTSDIFRTIGSTVFEIDNVHFKNNVSGTYGVISLRQNYSKIQNSKFEGNSGSSVVYQWNGFGNIDNSQFINNTATYNIRYRGVGNTFLTNSTISGGLTGIYFDRSFLLTLKNVTISGNTNTGINLFTSGIEAVVNIFNSTFYNNGTAANGNLNIAGGTGGNFLTLSAYNSIFAINNIKTNCMTLSGNYLLQFTNSVLDEASCGAGGSNIISNPMLGVLQNNGGPMSTHLPNLGSPTIDAGNNTYCEAADQRGLPRPVQQTAGTPVCDIGAVEIQ